MYNKTKKLSLAVIISLITFCSVISQQTISGPFLSYDILKLNSVELLSSITDAKSYPYQMSIGKYDLTLTPSNIISPDYISMTSTGPFVNPDRAIPLHGYTSKGGNVRLTLAENFVYGYIEDNGLTYYIEPASYYSTIAKSNEFILYDSKSIIETEEKTCGVNATKKSNQSSIVPESLSLVGECFDIDYPVAADYAYVTKYGGAAGAENKIIGVINNINTDYDDSFADQLTFVLTGSFLVTTNGGDPWTTSTNVDVLLNSYISWANGYWDPNGIANDVSSFWSDRDFDGSTIGYAPVGVICGSSSHNILQDFSSNANQIRVLTSHELGHNFSASHDASGSQTIMAPSVTNVTAWSTTSINSINAHVASRTCLSTCAPTGVTPTIQFTTSSIEVSEFATTGSTGSCNLDYVTHNVVISLSNQPSENISVTVNIDGSSTASSTDDYTLIGGSILFVPGGSTFKNIEIRIFEDHIPENPETINLSFTVNSGTVNIGANTTHEITIIDLNDEVSASCCTGYTVYSYGSYNYNAGTIFVGNGSDGRSRAIYSAADLAASGITAGPINAIALGVASKASTQPYQDFRIGLAETTNTDLNGMAWIPTDQHYLADHTTTVGLNVFEFDTPFIWDGTSNLYIQWCFDNTTTSGVDNIQHSIPPVSTSGDMTHFQTLIGTDGCNPNTTSYSYYGIAIQPRIFIVDNLGAQAETDAGTVAQSQLNSGDTANMYSANSKIIASMTNTGSSDINCVEATISTAGNGKIAASFGVGDYTAKTYEISGDNTDFYDLTVYYTDEELATWGGNANALNMVRSTVPFASATTETIEIIEPTEIIEDAAGNTQVSYRGSFSGFSYIALTDVEAPALILSDFMLADVVINSTTSGLVFQSLSGIDFKIQATNANTFLSTPTTGNNMIEIEKGDVYFSTPGTGIILKKPGAGYVKLSVSNLGAIEATAMSSLPNTHFLIDNGNFTIKEDGKSLILKNPNGDCYKIYINGVGELGAVPLAVCP